jgi:hypothetical protein
MAERRPLVFRQNRIIELPAGDTIVGGGGGGGPSTPEFLTVLFTDLEDPDHYYYGGLDSSDDWRINRYSKLDLNALDSAAESNNGSFVTLTAAWDDRTTLVYGELDEAIVPFIETEFTDLTNSSYYYYGGLTSDGDWKINRYDKTNLVSREVAMEATNVSYTTLADAWAARGSLVYG